MGATHICPKGHVSSDADYCSECGGIMQARTSAPVGASRPVTVMSANPAVAAVTDAPALCPDCMTPRAQGGRYCEVCRYDFLTGKSFAGQLDAPAVAPAAEPSVTSIAAPVTANPVAAGNGGAQLASASAFAGKPSLRIKVLVDASLYTDPDPENPLPQDRPAATYHLDLREMTLGRQYQSGALHPEIVVADASISRAHLKFLRLDSGDYVVVDLGSANGTALNGQELVPHQERPLAPGDHLTLGMWTRIQVESR